MGTPIQDRAGKNLVLTIMGHVLLSLLRQRGAVLLPLRSWSLTCSAVTLTACSHPLWSSQSLLLPGNAA